MRPLRLRMDDVSRRDKAPLPVLERDYLLSWTLAGLSAIEPLKKNLIFKGGTALKKCYFGDYRFSEDLDFSARQELPRRKELEALLVEACAAGNQAAGEFSPIELACERYEEKQPHPAGQEVFKIKGKLPWHRDQAVPVYVEITFDEPILDHAADRPILHGYEETISAKIACYPLNEIVAEKLRGILQYKAKLQGQRGWAKSRARDYYDLWRILNDHARNVDAAVVLKLFPKKCAVRKVTFSDQEQFFEAVVLNHARENWEKSLGSLVPGVLPAFDYVVEDLRIKLKKIF